MSSYNGNCGWIQHFKNRCFPHLVEAKKAKISDYAECAHSGARSDLSGDLQTNLNDFQRVGEDNLWPTSLERQEQTILPFKCNITQFKSSERFTIQKFRAGTFLWMFLIVSHTHTSTSKNLSSQGYRIIFCGKFVSHKVIHLEDRHRETRVIGFNAICSETAFYRMSGCLMTLTVSLMAFSGATPMSWGRRPVGKNTQRHTERSRKKKRKWDQG